MPREKFAIVLQLRVTQKAQNRARSQPHCPNALFLNVYAREACKGHVAPRRERRLPYLSSFKVSDHHQRASAANNMLFFVFSKKTHGKDCPLIAEF
jgi:hypothetical protein